MNKSFSYIALLFFSILIFISLLVSCEQKKEISEEKEHGIELGELMFHNQRYIEKLYFAGINKNWELTKFYHHELEENMEKITNKNIKEDGKDISSLTDKMFMPSLKEIENIIAYRDSVQFLKGYNLLINSCNSCHIASDHGFVKIKVPTAPSMTNQEF